MPSPVQLPGWYKPFDLATLQRLNDLNPFDDKPWDTYGVVVSVTRKKLASTIISELSIILDRFFAKVVVYGDGTVLLNKLLILLALRFDQQRDGSFLLRVDKNSFIGNLLVLLNSLFN